jgi:hypothetical protein
MNESISRSRQATLDPPPAQTVVKPVAPGAGKATSGKTVQPGPAVESGPAVPDTRPQPAQKGKAAPVLTETLIAAWDTERVDNTVYLETVLPDVRLDLEEIGGSWDAFPDFLARLKAMQVASGDEPKHVTLILNVHGNNGTGLKMVDYRREAGENEPAEGPNTHADVSIASAAQINVWLKEAGFDPSQITVISEVCNAGPAYWGTIDGINAGETAKAKASAAKLAVKEHVTLGAVEFHDPKAVKPDLTYLWIGRRNGGNTAGTVFLQAATGMGTNSVSGKVAAAPIVNLNTLGKPGQVKIAITGERNPWPDAHFDEMIDSLRSKTPRFFAPTTTPAPAEAVVPAATITPAEGPAPKGSVPETLPPR